MPATIQYKTLKNGTSVTIITHDDFTTARLSIAFEAGRFDLSTKESVALHALEHLTLKSGEGNQRLGKLLCREGGDYNASVGLEETEFWLESKPSLFMENAGLLAKAVANPSITEEGLAHERSILQAEWHEASGLERDLGYAFLAALIPSASTSEDNKTLAEIAALTTDEVESIRQRLHESKRVIVATLTKDLDPSLVITLLEKELGTLPPASREKKPYTVSDRLPYFILTPCGGSRTMTRFAFGMDRSPGDTAISNLTMLEAILSSSEGPLQETLRHQKALVYSVETDSLAMSRAISLMIDVQQPIERAKSVASVSAGLVLGELGSLITEEDLESAKAAWIEGYEMNLKHPGFWEMFAQGCALGPRSSDVLESMEEEVGRVRGLTLEAMREFCQELIKPERLICMVVGPFDPENGRGMRGIIQGNLAGAEIAMDSNTEAYLKDPTFMQKVLGVLLRSN